MEVQPRMLMLASVASMIDLFNMENIRILQNLGCKVDVSSNFQNGSITSQERVNEFKTELENMGIEVIDTPIPRSIFSIKSTIDSYRMVKKLVEERHYRIVHCHSPIGGVVARLACRNARKKGTKVVYTGHGLHFFKGAPFKNWLIFYPIERLCAKMTDVLIAINQEDYQRERSWDCCQVEYVPGIGVNTVEFQKPFTDREKMRVEFGFTDEDFVFMSTGQISVRKNHEVVIRALAKVKNPHVKYLIVGFGELQDKLCALVDELGVNERVVFAGYRGDVRNLLHVVDGFAFPSLQEGLPVALMEAMAAGLPVVCSRIRGNVDLIQDGKGGFIYDCRDVDGFAEGLTKIAQGESVTRMGEINMETMKKFDTSVVNKKMNTLYKELLQCN